MFIHYILTPPSTKYQVFYCLVMHDGWGDLYNLLNVAHPKLLKAYPSMHDLTPIYMILIDKTRYDRCVEVLNQHGITAPADHVHIIKTDVSLWSDQHSNYDCIDENVRTYIASNPLLQCALKSNRRLITIASCAQQYSMWLRTHQINHLGELGSSRSCMGFTKESLGVFIPWLDVEKLKSEDISDEKYTTLVLGNSDHTTWKDFLKNTDVVPYYAPSNLSEAGNSMREVFLEIAFKEANRDMLLHTNNYTSFDDISKLNNKYKRFSKIVYNNFRETSSYIKNTDISAENTLYVVCSAFLPKNDFLRLQSHAKIIGCSGDTSFLDVIALGKIPFYLTPKHKKEMVKSFLEFIKNEVAKNSDKNILQPYFEIYNELGNSYEKSGALFLDYYQKSNNERYLSQVIEKHVPLIEIKNLISIFENCRTTVIHEKRLLKNLPSIYINNRNDTGELLNALMYDKDAIYKLERTVNSIVTDIQDNDKADKLKNAYSKLKQAPCYENLLDFIDIVNTHRNNLHFKNETNTYTTLLASLTSQENKTNHGTP